MCHKCKNVFDAFRPISNRNEPISCKNCGGEGKRHIESELDGINIIAENVRVSRSLAMPIDKVKSGEAFKTHPGADFGKPNRGGMCPMTIHSRNEKMQRIKERSKAMGIPLQEM